MQHEKIIIIFHKILNQAAKKNAFVNANKQMFRHFLEFQHTPISASPGTKTIFCCVIIAIFILFCIQCNMSSALLIWWIEIIEAVMSASGWGFCMHDVGGMRGRRGCIVVFWIEMGWGSGRKIIISCIMYENDEWWVQYHIYYFWSKNDFFNQN